MAERAIQTMKAYPPASYRVLMSIRGFLSKLSDSSLDRLARGMAVLAFDILRLRRRVVLRNLEIAFGDRFNHAERVRIGRRSAYHVAMHALELIARTDSLSDQVEVVDRHHLDEALKAGKGAYILASHLGSWEASGASVSRQVAPAHVIVKPLKSPGPDRFLQELRRASGFLTIERRSKGDAYRQMRRILEKNELVGIAFDHARPDSPKYPFFSRPAKTNTSVAFIHRRHPAPFLPICMTRIGPCRHRLQVLPPLQLQISDDIDADVEANTRMFQKTMEDIITQHPEHYFWYHNRWKI